MKRIVAATMFAGGLLLLAAEAVLAQAPPPPPLGPPPTPAQIAARRACNNVAAGPSRILCVTNACNAVSPFFRGMCTAGAAMFAAGPPAGPPVPPIGPPTNVAQRRACNTVPPANRQACINAACGPVAPNWRGACTTGAGPYAALPAPPTNVAQRRACNTVPPANRQACINAACGPVAPNWRGACTTGAGPYAAGPVPPRPTVPVNVAARRACNTRPPVERGACIARACGPVAPNFKQACTSGTGPYAALPAPPRPPVAVNVAARRACNTQPAGPPRTACITNACRTVPAPLQGACRAGSGPYAGGPPPALGQLNTLRNEIGSRRSRAVALCKQLYDGAAELNCIRGLFPPAPAPAN